MTDQRPTIDEQMAAQASIRARLASEATEAQNESERDTQGCLALIGGTAIGIVAAVGVLGGWLYVLSALF